MTLFVMSAYVAFNGFPGQDVQDPIGTLLLQERQAPVNVPAVPIDVHVRAATRSPVVRHHRAAARRARGPQATGTGEVKHRISTPAPVPASAPATSAPASQPATPQLPATTPSVPTISLPKVQLPVVQTPDKVALPVDTSGITNLLSGK